MDVSIALAGKRDIPGILELYVQLFAASAAQQPRYWQEAQADPKFIREAVDGYHSDIFVAWKGGRMVGFAHVQEKTTQPFACMVPHRYAYLMDLLVDESHRGQGIGSGLLDRVRRWAEHRGLDYLELNVLEENRTARRLYEKMGYATAMRTMKCPL